MNKTRILWFVIGWFIGAMMFVKPATPAKNTPIVPTSTPITIPTTEPRTESRSVFREAYMGGCVTSETSDAYCGCTFDFIVDKYGMDKVVELGLEYQKTGELPSEMVEAAVSCYYLLK